MSCEAREDHGKWQTFQVKFPLTMPLYHHVIFFEKILYRVCKDFLKECVTVLELKHILGCTYGDDQKPISVAEELAIFKKIET